MFAAPFVEVVRVHASGTTCRPTLAGYTKPDVEIWARVRARSIRAAGGRPRDLVHVVYGHGLFIAAPLVRLRNRSPGWPEPARNDVPVGRSRLVAAPAASGR